MSVNPVNGAVPISPIITNYNSKKQNKKMNTPSGVQISTGNNLNKLVKKLMPELDDEKQKKIKDIRNSIAKGEYDIPAEAVAKKIVFNAIIDR